MWTHMHLVEGDLEARVDLNARMDSRLHEAEQWRLAKGLRRSTPLQVRLVESLGALTARFRQLLRHAPEPQEQCC